MTAKDQATALTTKTNVKGLGPSAKDADDPSYIKCNGAVRVTIKEGSFGPLRVPLG